MGWGSSVAMSCGVGHVGVGHCCGCGVAPIRPLAWEPPHTAGTALKSGKKKKKEMQICKWMQWSILGTKTAFYTFHSLLVSVSRFCFADLYWFW